MAAVIAPLMIAAIVGIGGAVLTMLAWRGEKAKKLYLSQCDVALANPRRVIRRMAHTQQGLRRR